MSEWNDAAFELAERRKTDAHDMRVAEAEAAQESEDRFNGEAASETIAAIRAIPQYAFNEKVAVMIVRALATKIVEGNWSHFEHATDAVITLDELSDDLEAA